MGGAYGTYFPAAPHYGNGKEVRIHADEKHCRSRYERRTARISGNAVLPLYRGTFCEKGEAVINKNKEIFKEGYDTAVAAMQGVELGKLAVPEKKDQLYLLGNEAAALGAISAGSRFMASYPITPASEIMEYMIKVAHKIHGTVVQTEDELSSVMMAMGAGYGGVRAFTATSGPGLSLMAESISMAAVAEIPVVIIDVMRAGPSTGMATKVEQSDIRYAVGSGHGDAEKIVLAAASIEDCYYIVQEAFNLAEEYQTPVIVLSDLQFGMCKQSVPAFDRNRIGIRRGKLVTEGLSELDMKTKSYFHRFEDTEDGISPRTIPGVKNGMFLSTGLEHNVFGKPAEGQGDRVMEMESATESSLPFPKRFSRLPQPMKKRTATCSLWALLPPMAHWKKRGNVWKRKAGR